MTYCTKPEVHNNNIATPLEEKGATVTDNIVLKIGEFGCVFSRYVCGEADRLTTHIQLHHNTSHFAMMRSQNVKS